MKTYLNISSITLVTMLLFSNLVNADAPIDTRKNNAIARQVINAPAAKVWEQISRFDGVENFIPEVFKSTSTKGSGVGATRICIHHDGRELTEKMVAFDPSSMTLTYTLISGGEQFPMENTYNSVQVHPISDEQSLLVWSSKYDIKAGNNNVQLFNELTQGAIAMVTAGAKRYIEGLD